MAEKVDKTALVLPLSVEGVKKKKKKKQARSSSVLIDSLPTVRGVILWTLFNAGNVTFSFALGPAYCMLIDTILSHRPAPPLLLPRAEGTEVVALMAGMLWCCAPQAAAGVLALMFPSHRRRLRLFLAYAALVATVAGHCMVAALVRMFVAADPEGLYFRTAGTAAVVIVAVSDLRCFLGLVLRGGEE